MRVLYFHLSRFFDTTLDGILIGLITGVAINILTGENSNKFSLALICYAVACLLMILLIRKRQFMDRELEKRAAVKATLDEKWRASIQIDNWKKRTSYLALLFAFFGVVIWGTLSVIDNRKADVADLKFENKKFKDSLLVLSAENELLKKIFLAAKDTVGKAETAGEKSGIEKKSASR